MSIPVFRNITIYIDRTVHDIRVTCSANTTHKLFIFGCPVCIDTNKCDIRLHPGKRSVPETDDTADTEHAVMRTKIDIPDHIDISDL